MLRYFYRCAAGKIALVRLGGGAPVVAQNEGLWFCPGINRVLEVDMGQHNVEAKHTFPFRGGVMSLTIKAQVSIEDPIEAIAFFHADGYAMRAYSAEDWWRTHSTHILSAMVDAVHALPQFTAKALHQSLPALNKRIAVELNDVLDDAGITAHSVVVTHIAVAQESAEATPAVVDDIVLGAEPSIMQTLLSGSMPINGAQNA